MSDQFTGPEPNHQNRLRPTNRPNKLSLFSVEYIAKLTLQTTPLLCALDPLIRRPPQAGFYRKSQTLFLRKGLMPKLKPARKVKERMECIRMPKNGMTQNDIV
jgi:hypothetical protein